MSYKKLRITSKDGEIWEKLCKDAKETLGKMLVNKLADSPFPTSELPKTFHEYLKKALRFNSKGGIKCSNDTWVNFITLKRDLTLGELSLACVVLENATSDELGQNLEENWFVVHEDVLFPIYQKKNDIEEEASNEIKSFIKATFIEKNIMEVGQDPFI